MVDFPDRLMIQPLPGSYSQLYIRADVLREDMLELNQQLRDLEDRARDTSVIGAVEELRDSVGEISTLLWWHNE